MLWLLIVPCATLVVFGGYIIGYGIYRALAKRREL